MYASQHQRVEGSAGFVIFEVCGSSRHELLKPGQAADSLLDESLRFLLWPLRPDP